MKIERVNSYDNSEFSNIALYQHGAFLIDDIPCEFVIVSKDTATITTLFNGDLTEVIEEFRFYAEHITKFVDNKGNVVKEYPTVDLFECSFEDLQPSQFYLSMEKAGFIETWLKSPEDVFIPATKYDGKYIILDGHTRLAIAYKKGFQYIYIFESEASDYIIDFVLEAKRRNIFHIKDLEVLSSEEYQKKWHDYCDEYFMQKEQQI